MQLSRLPIEALKTLTSYLAVGEICNLVASGDVVLNGKLGRGGVHSFNLRWLESSPIPCVSGILALLPQLEACSISTPMKLVGCRSMELATLPPNLNSLSLHFDGLWSRLEAQNICFSTLLPSLTSLELSCNHPWGLWQSPAACSNEYVQGLLGSLPPSLTRLKCWPAIEHPARILSTFLHLLPSTLVSLDLQLPLYDDDPTAVFPPHLEDLRIDLMTLPPDISIFSKLPPSLLKLHFSASIMGVTDIHILPSDIPLLPPLLTHLSTGWSYSTPVWKDSDASLLPRQLKEFSGAGSHTWTEACLEHLPPGLEYMNRITISSPSHDINRFVPNLKRLGILGYWEGQPVNGLVFPSRLVDVNLPSISDEICVILPKTLEQLMADEGVFSGVGAAALSKGLRSLTVPVSAFANDEVLEHLGHVEVMNWTPHEDDVNLTENCLQHVTVVGKRGWTKFSVVDDLLGSSWPCYSSFGASLSRLTNLEHFSFPILRTPLRRSTSLSDFDFPPTLRSLCLKDYLSAPSHRDLLLLPRRLQSLTLDWDPTEMCDWTPETLQALPRSLHTLQLPYFPPGTQDEILPHLPPYLTSCRSPAS